MATQPADLRMTLAEFLDWDDGTETRYELIDGRVLAMAPPNPRHSALTGQLARMIGNGLQPPCRVFVEAGIVTPDRPDTYLQADLAVSCRPPREQERDVAEPILVVEVESPGTVRHDRGVKVDRYRELVSVQEIPLVASQERRVQLWRRQQGKWSVEDVIGDASLRLESCALTIPLAELYAGALSASMELNRRDNQRVIRAPRGPELSARSWQTEAPLRMLMNNLDPEVAERPQELVVYGGIGRAARDWRCYDVLVETLKTLGADETLLVQSGKPVGVFRTHADAPRVLIANSNLVAHWANWERFHELDRLGLMMYGQMTAGSWIYIGSQGIIQGTYETFVEAGRQHYGGDLCRQMDPDRRARRHGRRPAAGRDDGRAPRCSRSSAGRAGSSAASRPAISTDGERPRRGAGPDRAELHRAPPLSVGLLGNAAEVFPELVRRGVLPEPRDRPDRSARSPERLSAGRLDARALGSRCSRTTRPRSSARPRSRWRSRSARCSTSTARACRPSTTATTSASSPRRPGVADAFEFPGFVPAYIRPLFCRGKGPFRWAALSGDPADIDSTDAKVKELIPDDQHLHNWLDLAAERIAFQGLPARICWLGLGERARVGLAFNDMVARGELKAPIVIGRDHLDSGSVASPNRETEAMRDGSDAIADWPLLNAMLNVASGATWVSIHHGGGVGIGFSQHAGMVVVCDGTPEAARRLERVLTNDPASGVMRHADAGYPDAIACANEHGLRLPMLPS